MSVKTKETKERKAKIGIRTNILEVGDPNFDWGSIRNNNYVPKHREIIEEIEKPTGEFSLELLKKFQQYEGLENLSQVEVGSKVKGKVIGITEKDVTLDINNKDNVIIERKGSEERVCQQLKIGQELDVLITSISEQPFLMKGSISDLVRIKVDTKMKEFFENKISIDAYVREIIPAGYMLNIDIDSINIDAFMPNTLADVNKLYNPEVLLGHNIKVMLETLQQDKGIYVVSRKRYLKTLIPDKVKELKSKPKDEVYTGYVTGTRDFGVFVQFEECLTGMIHKANINEKFRDNISNIQPGTEIDFYVKDIIKGGNQIILTQTLEESLWDTVRVGDKLKGKVITVKPFGALIALDYETNGLIQTTYINKNDKSLKSGEMVDVIVISIIRDDRKIYLTFADDDEMVEKLKEKSTEIDKLKQKYNSKD
jgi:small subunit ribosomal protein S1